MGFQPSTRIFDEVSMKHIDDTAPASRKRTLTPADVSLSSRKPSSLLIVFGPDAPSAPKTGERPRG